MAKILTPKNPLIFAFDQPDFFAEREDGYFLESLAPHIGMVKIGHQMITGFRNRGKREINVGREALEFVRDTLGIPIMWDAKLRDIKRTTIAALQNILGMGVHMVTIDAAMSEESLQSVAGLCGRYGTLPLAVTVLTDIPVAECIEIYGDTPAAIVPRLAERTLRCGIKGLVCSTEELYALSRRGLLGELITIVPGVRPSWSHRHDQKRVATPTEAMKAGANYVVLGRSIIDSENRVQAAQWIVEEIAKAK